MKKLFVIVLAALSLIACEDKKQQEKNQVTLASSSGKINSVAVVSTNEMWEGKVGEAVRDVLTQPVKGLPQPEPIFSLNHIPPQSFGGFVHRKRLFLKIELADSLVFAIKRNVFARPQTAIYLKGPGEKAIVSLLKKHKNEIIGTFKKAELKKRQNQISTSLLNDKKIEERLGISIHVPSLYRYGKVKEDFIWLRKDITDASMEILLYEVPLSRIEIDSNTVNDIVAIRDSIGKKYIPGPDPKNDYMITGKAYAPFLFKTNIDGHLAFETRGTWVVKGFPMAGPFLNYAIRDKKNNRYVIVEGFVFKPSRAKRNNIFEMEAILRSTEFIR